MALCACFDSLAQQNVPPECQHFATAIETLDEQIQHLESRRGDATEALERGVLVVPAGLDGSLIQATPPLTITAAEVADALERLE